ncbi:hypothetical protein D3C85_149260 [compost metagenome]
MSKQEAVLEFSANVLKDVGVFDASGEGFLSYLADDLPKPVTIGPKRLCLPVRSILEDGQWERRIAFAPLAEQISQGPSPVLNAFKEYVQLRLKETFKVVIISLMELAVDQKRHKGLKADAAKFLQLLVEADQKTLDTLIRVLNAVGSAPEKRLVSLFLKNGGEGGALRSCVVSFPIMEDAAAEDTTTFFGVKMARKTKDKHLIVNLLEYVLGNEEERKAFTKSSNDGEAPYFHSLLLSFHAMATHLNKLIDRHKAGCSSLDGLRFGLEWTEQLVDFTNFAATHGRAIPVLPGNRGKERDEAIKKEALELDADDLGLAEEDRPRRGDSDVRDRERSRRDEPERERSWRDSRREEPEERGSRRDRDEREEPSRSRDEDGGRSLSDILRGAGRGGDDDRDRGRSSRDEGRRGGRDGGRNSRYTSRRGTGRNW